MDGAWPAKCAPPWPHLPAPAAPLPPLLPGPAGPSSSTVNQMGRNSHQLLHSIGQGTNLGNTATVQESVFFNTLNLDSCKAGKAELGNSYLDLLSGRSQFVSSDFLQLPSSASTLTNLHVRNGGIVSGASCGVPITSIPSLSDNHGNAVLGNGELSPFAASRLLPVSACTNTSFLHDNFQIAASNATVCHQAFQGNNTGIEVSSRKHGWPTSSSSSNASQQHKLNQTIHRMRFGAKPSISSHPSSNYFGRHRVFCMNKAGELFVSDMGVLGVICFCHEVPMSVAKFCEHSGSPSTNPGDAIHLENGMTIAQWRKLCFGVMSSGYGNGWEWSEDAIVGFKLGTSSKNSASVNSLEASSGSGRYGEPRHLFASSNYTDTRSRQIVLEKAANSTHRKSDLKGHNLFPKSFVGSPTNTMPDLAKNHTVQEVKGNPFWMSFEGTNLTSNKGKQNVRPQVVGNSVSYMGEIGNHPTTSPCLGTRDSFPCEDPISKGDFSSGMNKSFIYSRESFSREASVLDQDGVSSDIELRLGHLSGQSSNNQTSVKSFPAAIHPLQFRTECNPPNPPLHHPLTHRNDYPKETKKSRLSLQSDSQSFDRRHMQHSVGTNSCRLLESEDPMVDATKSSLISFLSHLNTGGNGSSQSTDINDVYNEYCSADPLYAKHNLSNFTRDISGGIELKSNTNGSDFSNNKNQGKKLKVADSGSCGTVKPSYFVHHKQAAETSGIHGHYVHGTPMDIRNPTVYFNQSSAILQPTPYCRNSSQCAGVSFKESRGPCCHATCSSASPVPSAAAIPDSGSFETPMRLTSANSIYTSEPHPGLLYNKNTDESQNSRDGSLRSLSLRHMAEWSKMEQSTSSHETNLHRRRLCCISDIQSRNIHKEDLMATEQLRDGPFCITEKDAPRSVKSRHSFSNLHIGCDAQVLPIKPNSTSPYGCCNCFASPQKNSLCSTEHGIQFCGFHLDHADKQHCLRYGVVSTNGVPDNIEHEMHNQKEESSSFSGRCCCSFVPKYLTGCHFLGHDNPSSSLKEHVFQKTMLENPAFDIDHMPQDGKSNRFKCECLRNMKNNWQIAPWEDVSSKASGHSGSTSNENPTHMLPCTRIVGDQITKVVAKEFDGTVQESESVKERQMSNVSSGSSAPAVTEVSVEINNVVSFAADVKSAKTAHNFMVDEGSGIEKCASSDEALGCSGFEEAIAFRDNPVYSSGNLIDELRLESSSNLKRKRNQITAGCTSQEHTSQIKQFKQALKSGKRNGKMNILDISVSGSPKHVAYSFYHSCSQEIDPSSQHDNDTQKTHAFFGRSSGVKRKRSALSFTKPFSFERYENNQNSYECNSMQSIDDDNSLCMEKDLGGKNAKQDLANVKQKRSHLVDGKPPKYVSLSHIGNSVNHEVETSFKKLRPVVCGSSGIISSGASGQQKPAKLVSLSLILKKSSSCRIPEYTRKSKRHLIPRNKKACLNANSGSYNVSSSRSVQTNNEDHSVVMKNGTNLVNLVTGKNKKSSKRSVKCLTEIPIAKNEVECGSNEGLKTGLHLEDANSQSKPKCKGTRKCSLSKITGTTEHISQSNCLPEYGENKDNNLMEARNLLSTDCGDAFMGDELNCTSIEVSKCASPAYAGLGNDYQNDLDHENIPCEVNIRRFTVGGKCMSFLSDSDSDSFCCVCGSSNKEDINNLLECSRCLIKVHQACYGVSKLPKGHWCCRPCKMKSSNIVCVLCGYGGGAMTRALKSRNTVKSLLKAWNVGTGSILINSAPSAKSVNNESVKQSSVGEASEYNGSIPVVGSTITTETVPSVASKIDPEHFQISNSVTAGIFDLSATQWVHMVCGLWTPGTRCPNVDTMSAFDVSGASPSRKNSVCSMCSRPGGSCIQCRVMNCSVRFHPWCAHQKGLLQSEIEGDDNENVGFYGRCIFHATHYSSYFQSNPVVTEMENSKKDWWCARTEGFKGRKREEALNPYCQKPSSNGTGCIVSQEQINAWLHINGQRSCTKGVVKPGSADMEYDVRKEYFRYKQSKAWKNLVVYKSGIHALGLYTSQFISRGAMVVEYVGEIVGLRVADKREVEYQSGRRLQYKSACYFFRIDKEHIIDATRKGGIARFVNHSCLPNCVAKVISIRNEKKVVFFAERDIYPGEEITYDYHFNHEDEGEKIPCFCNSKNCRRYLN